MAVVAFLFGMVVGAGALIVAAFFYVFGTEPNRANSIGNGTEDDDILERRQYQPFSLPDVRFVTFGELRRVIFDRVALNDLKRNKESCMCFTLLFHFLYQEFRDKSTMRRWVLKRLQMEFDDLTSRTGGGKILRDIRIYDLMLGDNFPLIKNVTIDKVKMDGFDDNIIEEISLLFDVEYSGGARVSVDVAAMLGRSVRLAVQLERLNGTVRLHMTRVPYTHWTLAFVADPDMHFTVDSHVTSTRLRQQLIPVIIQQFRRAIHRKHVLPNYKVRYKPFFTNALLVPTATPTDFQHIPLVGALRLSVLNADRLYVQAAPVGYDEVYCRVSLSELRV